MSGPFSALDYQLAVERLHGCSATFRETVRVVDVFWGEVAIDADVHVFELVGHPSAKLAYAWSQQVEGSTEPRILAILQQPPVFSPLGAVRAATVAHAKRRAIEDLKDRHD